MMSGGAVGGVSSRCVRSNGRLCAAAAAVCSKPGGTSSMIVSIIPPWTSVLPHAGLVSSSCADQPPTDFIEYRSAATTLSVLESKKYRKSTPRPRHAESPNAKPSSACSATRVLPVAEVMHIRAIQCVAS